MRSLADAAAVMGAAGVVRVVAAADVVGCAVAAVAAVAAAADVVGCAVAAVAAAAEGVG